MSGFQIAHTSSKGERSGEGDLFLRFVEEFVEKFVTSCPNIAMRALDKAIFSIDGVLEELSKVTFDAGANAVSTSASTSAKEELRNKGKQGKKVKKEASKVKEDAPESTPDDPFYKANLRVGRVLEVATVENSDKLYKLRVDSGGEPLQVITGLQQHVAADALHSRLVVLIVNLKPARLAGEMSEAMILAAECTLPDGRTLVTKLSPPEGAQPGDQVYLEGSQPPAATPKICKSSLWALVVEKLRTKDRRPAYADVPFCTSSGAVTVPRDMPDGSKVK